VTNVGREYAIALFEAAYEDGSLDAVREDLTEIRKLLKKEPDYISFLMNPGIPKEERLDSLSEAFEDNVEDLLYSFLAVMVTNNHMNEFFTAAKEFEKM
jgi:F-type H+-transporting ATPase subunit delta